KIVDVKLTEEQEKELANEVAPDNSKGRCVSRPYRALVPCDQLRYRSWSCDTRQECVDQCERAGVDVYGYPRCGGFVFNERTRFGRLLLPRPLPSEVQSPVQRYRKSCQVFTPTHRNYHLQDGVFTFYRKGCGRPPGKIPVRHPETIPPSELDVKTAAGESAPGGTGQEQKSAGDGESSGEQEETPEPMALSALEGSETAAWKPRPGMGAGTDHFSLKHEIENFLGIRQDNVKKVRGARNIKQTVDEMTPLQKRKQQYTHVMSHFDVGGLPTMVAHVKKDLELLDEEVRKLPRPAAVHSMIAKCRADVKYTDFEPDEGGFKGGLRNFKGEAQNGIAEDPRRKVLAEAGALGDADTAAELRHLQELRDTILVEHHAERRLCNHLGQIWETVRPLPLRASPWDSRVSINGAVQPGPKKPADTPNHTSAQNIRGVVIPPDRKVRVVGILSDKDSNGTICEVQ
ncbi:unnamed protein product, partial [Amoebophrya sp. A120]